MRSSVQPVEASDAWLLSRPILQEYDASTVVEVTVESCRIRKLAARRNLVEIAEACRKESVAGTKDWIRNATVAARLLASPIQQEYDASTVGQQAVNPSSQFGRSSIVVDTDSFLATKD